MAGLGLEFLAEMVARPPRHIYTEEDLGVSTFSVDDQIVHRRDFRVMNRRGHMLECSHYVPLGSTHYPVVVYAHGNCGHRGDADAHVNLLLPCKMSVVSFDFSGAGLSGGNTCTLGYHESEDLRCVIDYVLTLKGTTSIALWGRSMGAAAAAMVAAADRRVDALVLDSCYMSIESVAYDVAKKYVNSIPFLEDALRMGTKGFGSIHLPKDANSEQEEAREMYRDAVQEFRAAVQRRCGFDLNEVCPRERLGKCRIPILFAHADGDDLVFPYHSQRMFDEYSGEKTHYILKGNHNSERGEEFLSVAKGFLMGRLAPPGRRKVLGEGGVMGNVKLEGYKGGAAHMAVAVGLAMAVASYLVQVVQ